MSFVQVKGPSGNGTEGDESADDKKSGASLVRLDKVALTSIAGMALSFVTGMVL